MSARRYTYELNVRDRLRPALERIKGISSSTYNKLTRGQQRFNTTVATGSQTVTGLKSRLTGMIGAYVSLGIGVMAARNTMKKWDAQVQAEAQVMQGLQTTNMAAGRSFEQLTKAASDLQQKTLFGDESILQGVTAQMLTFTNVTGTAFDRAQQAAVDVTTRLYGANASGESLRTTSIMLGKALNDPVANLGALGRSGIQFSESQKEMIKNLYKSGDAATAQAMILDELEKQYGGSAQAAAKVGMGAWQQFMNRIGDIQEKFGPFLNQILTGFIQLFDWVGRNARVIGFVTTAVMGALVAYKTIMIVTKTWTAIQWALNAAMNANPLGIIITLIGAMIAAVIYAWYKFDGFRGAVFGLWEAFKSVFTGIRDLVGGVMGGVGELILGALTFDIDRIQGGLSKLGQSFANYGRGIAAAYKAGSDAGKKYQPKVPDFLSFGGQDEQAAGKAGAGGTGGIGGLGMDIVTGGNVQAGISGITSGGSKPTTINITLSKFQDQLVIHANGIQEGIDEMEDRITEGLIRILNSANKVATQ